MTGTASISLTVVKESSAKLEGSEESSAGSETIVVGVELVSASRSVVVRVVVSMAAAVVEDTEVLVVGEALVGFAVGSCSDIVVIDSSSEVCSDVMASSSEGVEVIVVVVGEVVVVVVVVVVAVVVVDAVDNTVVVVVEVV